MVLVCHKDALQSIFIRQVVRKYGPIGFGAFTGLLRECVKVQNDDVIMLYFILAEYNIPVYSVHISAVREGVEDESDSYGKYV